jgi:hypothetical protein
LEKGSPPPEVVYRFHEYLTLANVFQRADTKPKAVVQVAKFGRQGIKILLLGCQELSGHTDGVDFGRDEIEGIKFFGKLVNGQGHGGLRSVWSPRWHTLREKLRTTGFSMS